MPRPGMAAGGMRWLVPPDGGRTLNDPAELDDALPEAAARIAAGDPLRS
ncbi:hypothetical protein [Streptomyces sp. rh34]|nr:hypothetical protein [Streptomyces sp. rh34]